MIVEDINKELEEIYSSLMENYSNIPIEADEVYENEGLQELKVSRDILTFPFLLQINGILFEKDKRIMVFGQETNGWGDKEFRFWGNSKDFLSLPESAREKLNLFPSLIGGKNKTECIKNLTMSLMALYNYHNLYDFSKCDGGYYNSVYTLIKEHSYEYGYSVIRNNIAKIGYYEEKGNDINLNLEFIEFIVKEIELLTPDILIFLTGPESHIKLMSELLSKLDEKFDKSQLIEKKPDYKDRPEKKYKGKPVNELSPISFMNKQVRILWSYHPYGAVQNRYLRKANVLQRMKDEYIRLIK